MAGLLTSERDQAVLRTFAQRIDDHDPGAHNNLGVLYFNKGMTEDAVRAFARALELDPRMTIAQRNLEIAYFTSGYYDVRVQELEARLQHSSKDKDARWELGRIFLLLGEPKRAVEEFGRLLRDTPHDIPAIRQLATAEGAAGDLESAARWIAHAIDLEPDNAALHFQAGEIAYHRGLNDEAHVFLTKAVALAPEDADALYLLGFVLGDLGRHEEAQAAAKRALRMNPAIGRAHANLSLERFDASSYDKAREMRGARGLSDALQVVEGEQLAHFSLGLAFRQKGYLEEALREYRIALKRGEDAALVLQAIAEVHLLKRDPRAAVTAYDHCLKDVPNSPKLWNERGVALHQLGKYAEAESSYQRALDVDQNYVLAHNNVGVAAFHKGDSHQALASFRRALELQPGFTKARLNCALLLVRQGQAPLALEAYRQVLRLVPDHPVAWNGVGQVLSDMRRYDDARNAFARAIEGRPDFAEAFYNLSFALSHLGEYQAALQATKRALELDAYYTPQKFELAIDLEYEDPRMEISPDLGGDVRSENVEAFAFEASTLDTLFGELGATAPDSTQSAEPDALSAARLRLSAGDAEHAMALARRALGEGAPRALALTVMGEAFHLQGAFGEAVERFREARAVDAGYGQAAEGELRALVALRRFEEATPVAEWLASHAADRVDVLMLVAEVRAETDRVSEALDVLHHARKLAPMRADVLTALGRVHIGVGELAEGAVLLRDAVALDRDAVFIRVELARVLETMGDVAAAERELASALQLRPHLEDAVLALAALRRRGGRASDTVNLLADFLQRHPYHLDALASLAESLVAGQRRSDARVAVDRVLKFDPDHVAALYFRGVLDAEQHAYDAALSAWARVVDLEPAGEFARRARRDTLVAKDLQRIFVKPTASGRGGST